MTLARLHQVPSAEVLTSSAAAIKDYVHRTPLLSSDGINAIAGCKIWFKCENFQQIGAFKMRGAIRAALTLSEEEKQGGLATHSSGNHAQAVAKAAQLMGIPAHIVMPENAPAVKAAATKGYGANIYPCASTIEARVAGLKEVVAKTGAYFIPPFDSYDVIAGQATCAMEVYEDLDDVEAILAPVGGGGLMSGTCLASHYFSPNTLIYGSEPKEVDDAARSIQSGVLQTNSTINTIADGLKTSLSEKTFSVISQHIKEIITVSEVEIADAMKLIWQRLKLVVEPSAAVPLAALLQKQSLFSNKRVVIILSGGNVDIDIHQLYGLS